MTTAIQQEERSTQLFKFVKISKFRADFFLEGSAPTVNSIKKMILMGELTGKRFGGVQYIVIDYKLNEFDLSIYEKYELTVSNEPIAKIDTSNYSAIENEIIAEFS